MNFEYSLNEKVQVFFWHLGGKSYTDIQQAFANEFNGRQAPCRSLISKMVEHFKAYGCINSSHLRKRKIDAVATESDDDLEMEVLLAIEEDPHRSLRDLQSIVDRPVCKVNKILKKNKYKSFKIQKSNEIQEGDQFRRMEMCESLLEKANHDENFVKNILFTDESSFPIHGKHNPSVCRVWSRTNPHETYDRGTQRPAKLNVWLGMLGNHLVGPFFIQGTLTGPKYLRLLQEKILPALRGLPDVNMNEIWFQQDGCPAHNCLIVRDFLNAHFPNRLICGFGNSTIQWAPRSPDLSPNDFFLWGHLKSQIYQYRETRADNLVDLELKIINTCRELPLHILENVRRNFLDRLGFCLAAYGERFEHLR